jgi:hypothetical protein
VKNAGSNQATHFKEKHKTNKKRQNRLKIYEVNFNKTTILYFSDINIRKSLNILVSEYLKFFDHIKLINQWQKQYRIMS